MARSAMEKGEAPRDTRNCLCSPPVYSYKSSLHQPYCPLGCRRSTQSELRLPEIRRLQGRGLGVGEIAQRLGVSKDTIWNDLKGPRRRQPIIVWCPSCGDARTVMAPGAGYRRRDEHRERRCRQCAYRDGRGETPSREWLEAQYAARTSYEIAEELGVHPGTVITWLRRYGIPVRSPAEAAVFGRATRSERRYYDSSSRQMVTAGTHDAPGAVKPYGDYGPRLW